MICGVVMVLAVELMLVALNKGVVGWMELVVMRREGHLVWHRRRVCAHRGRLRWFLLMRLQILFLGVAPVVVLELLPAAVQPDQ